MKTDGDVQQRHQQKSINANSTALDNNSANFSWYGKNPSIHEIITFGCGIYPIPSSPKNLDYITQEGLFMVYTNSRATMKCWDPHTKKLKYFLSG